jgi:trigger factor
LEVKTSSPKPWLREVAVEVEPDRLKSKLEEMLSTYSSRAEIPGFRKGRAPRHVVERRLGSALEQAALEEVDRILRTGRERA